MLKDKLQIIIITYNRASKLQLTLQQILNNQNFKNCEISILDNASTDSTEDLIKNYSKTYNNIRYIRNPINVGGNANAIKAFELASVCNKEYFWVLCDDDEYNFYDEDKIEGLMNKGVDAICVERKSYIKEEKTQHILIASATFIPAIIYKTANIDSQILQNMYLNAYTCYPHLPLIINIANNKKTFAFGPKLVKQKVNDAFHRGCNKDEYFRIKNLILQVALINSYQMINDKKLRALCCKEIWVNKNFFKTMLEICKYNEMHSYNVTDTFWGLNFAQKIQFVLAYIIVKLFPRNYKYWNIQNQEEWEEYLKKVKEQKYINHLARKLKNKDVVIYGAGLVSNIIFNNYDLSKLNIIGISDKKFEKENTQIWNGYKIIKKSEAFNQNNIILIALKAYDWIEYKINTKRKLGLTLYPLVETNYLYPIATITKYNKFINRIKRYYWLGKFKKSQNRKKVQDDLTLIGKVLKFN